MSEEMKEVKVGMKLIEEDLDRTMVSVELIKPTRN